MSKSFSCLQILISHNLIKQNEWLNFPNTEFNPTLQLDTGEYSPRYWSQIVAKLGAQYVIYQKFANFTYKWISALTGWTESVIFDM